MKYLHLIWAQMTRRKIRTILTLIAVSAAFVLFGLLASVYGAFTEFGQNVAAAHRLVTLARSSYMVGLPLSLYRRIRAVPGVETVTYVGSFYGTYQDPRNHVGGVPTVRSYFKVFPEYKVPPDAWRSYERIRTGALVGASLAARYHWRPGELIPIDALDVPRRDGSSLWTFVVSGIFTARPKGMENAIIFHWRYFDSARAAQNGTVTAYLETIAAARQAGWIAHAIDALSANSAHETRTQTSSAIAANEVRQLGNIRLIVHAIMGAVLFTLILLTGNTLAQSVRERIPELAILKTLGFSGRNVFALVMSESVLMLAVGGLSGLTLADAVVHVVQRWKGPHVPMASLAPSIWLQGIAVMVLVGLVVGAVPAARAMRLLVVDALAGR